MRQKEVEPLASAQESRGSAKAVSSLVVPPKPNTADKTANDQTASAGPASAAPNRAALRSALYTSIAATLAACGGGDAEGDLAPPKGFLFPHDAPKRSDLLPHPGAQAADTSERKKALAAVDYRIPTHEELLDYAERGYANFFPGREVSRIYVDPQWGRITYRYYPATGNYVGVSDGIVLVLGPLSNGEITNVGTLRSFAAVVLAGLVAGWPASDEAAARFLLQAQFSASPAEIARVRSIGYEAWLDEQLAVPEEITAWDWSLSKGLNTIDENELFFAHGTYRYAVWYQLFNAPDAVRKRWALALSEVFVVSWRGIKDVLNWDSFAITQYWDLLNQHALGSYRSLLEDLTLCPAMGAFLGTRGNQREDPSTGRLPDENFARELMQLFSIGVHMLEPDGSPRLDGKGLPVESYTDRDVSQLARVFTGWDTDDSVGQFNNPAPPHGKVFNLPYVRQRMKLFPERHDPQRKTFLGVTIPENTPAAESLRVALDVLTQHPNTAPFLARQLIQRLVTSHPSPSYVARVASAFGDNGRGVRGDLRAVLKAILLDQEARSESSLSDPSFGKLREPMLRIAQWGRTFKLRSLQGRWKVGFSAWNSTVDIGQYPLDPPSVFSFFRPGYVPPGTFFATQGATAPEFQIVTESSVATWPNFLQTIVHLGIWVSAPHLIYSKVPTAQDGQDVVPDYAYEMSLVGRPEALIDHLNLLLCAGQLSGDTRALLLEALATDGISANSDNDFKRIYVARAIFMVMCSADYLAQR